MIRIPSRALAFVLTSAALMPWCSAAAAAKPGLARTPPMGWNSWEAFRKNLQENAIKAQADAMVQLGFRDAGYVYVVLDGGWKTSRRDEAGNLVADPAKFPHGMKALADYLHSLGLKLGLHQPAGIKDCGHDEPGSQNNEARDAALFASWGVDFIKYDQCDYIHPANLTPGAPNLDKIIIRSGDRPVFRVEAEARQNRLTGMAEVQDCPRCSGGKSVTAIGYAGGGVEIDYPAAASGRYTLDIQFEYPYFGQNRDHFKQMTLFVSVNGGTRHRLDMPYSIPQRYTTGTISTEIDLNKGENTILLDNPLSQEDDVRLSYLKMGDALEHSGRDIIFSTSGAPRPWLWGDPVAHMWRAAFDINNRWTGIMSILDRVVDTLHFAGPNFWADPDMLEVGAPARTARDGTPIPPMTVTEERSQFSLWAIMTVPLFISADLRHLDEVARSILLNRDVIAVNQDPLGAPGRRIRDGATQVFAKRLKGGDAVLLFNRSDTSIEIRATAAELGINRSALHVRDLWTGQTRRVSDGVISAIVEPHGVKMYLVRDN